MKKAYMTFLGIAVALMILLGYKTTAEASSYKAQLILDSYELSEDYAVGEDTTIKVSFKNTDNSYFIRNILINCSSNGNTVIPVEGKSNQVYLDAIRPGETVSVDLPIVITHSEGGYASMTFAVEYMSDDTRWSSNSYIVFPVNDSASPIVVKSINVPGDVTVNGNILVSTYFLNTSDKDLFNTEFVINGEIVGETQSISVGTVPTKRNAYAETYVSFNTTGKKIIDLSIVYEDANGKKHEDNIGQYAITVADNTTAVNTPITSISSNEDNTSSTSSNNNGAVIGNLSIATLLLIASGIIVLIIVVVVIVNVTRKRK